MDEEPYFRTINSIRLMFKKIKKEGMCKLQKKKYSNEIFQLEVLIDSLIDDYSGKGYKYLWDESTWGEFILCTKEYDKGKVECDNNIE